MRSAVRVWNGMFRDCRTFFWEISRSQRKQSRSWSLMRFSTAMSTARSQYSCFTASWMKACWKMQWRTTWSRSLAMTLFSCWYSWSRNSGS